MPADRILTTHVGSLARPPELLPHLRAMLAGEPVDQPAYEACLRASVADVVRRQVETGIDIVNDGEFGKSHWYRYAIERFAGVESRPAPEGAGQTYFGGADRARFPEFYAEYDKDVPRSRREWAAVGPVTYIGQAALARDIANLRAALGASPAHDAFLPVVAPASVSPEFRNEHYATEHDYVFALAEALRCEYQAITDAGFIVQIDDAWITAMFDRMVPPGTVADYRRWANLCIDALNHALRGLPKHRTRYHICWGSWNGPHTADIPLRDIVDLLLRIEVGGYSIEAANPRHEHEWRVWESVTLPEDRVLLPGVISHATNIVEHPELVAERLMRFADLVGRERVIASSDCGFAQGALYQRVHPSIMWAKLRAMVEGAEIATQRLWNR